MFKNEPDLLTRKQCQDLLHISKSKMLDLIHKDLIPAHIIAGSFRIEKADLIDFVQNSVTGNKNYKKLPENSQTLQFFLVSYKRIFLIFSHAKKISQPLIFLYRQQKPRSHLRGFHC